MSIGLVRPKGLAANRPRRDRESGPTAPSAREVCLLGHNRLDPPGDWSPGARVPWLGREYRIEAQDRRYTHLVPAGDRLPRPKSDR